MADVVNLRMARKAKARDRAAATAATNRALHGRTRGEKVRDAAEAQRATRLLDGARRESD